MKTLTIDKDFESLGTPLTIEERSLLEAQLDDEGCTDPIVTWANHDDTILDGHHRYQICRQLGDTFKTKALKFETKQEAMNWIIRRQLGRRNATEEQKSYYRGKRYELEKTAGHGEQSAGHSDPQNTAERLGEEHGVSEKTIKRDADYAAAIDTIAANAGEDARKKILSGELGATKKDVLSLASQAKAKQQKAVQGGREAVKRAVASPPKPFPASDRFVKLMTELSGMLEEIRQQYKSVPKMLRHKDWDKKETVFAEQWIHAFAKRFSELQKELNGGK